MPNINFFITHQGVHKSIDKEISGNNVAIPKSGLYQNIAVPRWSSVIGSDLRTILSNLFYNDYNDNFTYNIGFFKEGAKTGNFESLLKLCPAGTKVWFIKTDVEDYRSVFQEWIQLMRQRGNVKALRRKFREDSTFEDIDIDIEYEERTVDLDDFADLFSATEWKSFDSNVFLNIGNAEKSLLSARLYVKEDNVDIVIKKKKKKKNKEKNTDLLEIDQDDDYINEDDL